MVVFFTFAKAPIASCGRALMRVPFKKNQMLRIRNRHAAEDDGIDQAEDCRVRANSQRQREHRYHRERRRFTQHAPAIAKVLNKRLKQPSSMHFAQRFPRLIDAPKGYESLAARLCGCHTLSNVLLNFMLQMKTKFI